MEIQDINKNPISVLFNRGGLSVNGMQDAAFAGLLDCVGTPNDGEVLPSGQVQKKETSPVSNKAEAEDVSKNYKKRNKSNKADVDSGVKNDKVQKKAKSNDVPETAEMQTAQSQPDIDDVIKENPVASEFVAADAETSLPLAINDILNGVSLSDMVIVADGEEYNLSEFLAEPQKLASFANISFVGPQEQTVTVSGAEFFAAIIKNISAVSLDYSSIDGIDISELDVLPAEDIRQSDVKIDNVLIPDVPEFEAVGEGMQDEIARLEKDNGVKIEFDVTSKKLAVSTDELLKDGSQINVLTFNESEEVASTTQIVADGVSPVDVEQYTLSPTALKTDSADAYSAISPLAMMDNISAGFSAENGSGVSISSSAAIGNGFSIANRGEALHGRTETSFKDVYKGLSKEVVEQVKVNIVKSAVRGADKIDVSLKPQELGNIEIKMQLAKDGKLSAHIIATRPETIELLQKETSLLEQSFKDAGFQMDENGLSFSLRDNNHAEDGQNKNPSLRDFLGDAFEDGVNDFADIEAVSGENWGQNGLNIKV